MKSLSLINTKGSPLSKKKTSYDNRKVVSFLLFNCTQRH